MSRQRSAQPLPHVAVLYTRVTSPEGAIIRYIQGYGAKLDKARRRESTMRGRRARVSAGKPLPGPRARYGFRWADVRDAEGRRLRERLEHHPITGPVVDRVW